MSGITAVGRANSLAERRYRELALTTDFYTALQVPDQTVSLVIYDLTIQPMVENVILEIGWESLPDTRPMYQMLFTCANERIIGPLTGRYGEVLYIRQLGASVGTNPTLINYAMLRQKRNGGIGITKAV